MDVQQLVLLMGAGGGGAVLLALVNGLFKMLSGFAGREQQRNTDLATQRKEAIVDREKAEDERDEADRKRREAEEHVSILKRQVRELGAIPEERNPGNSSMT